MSRSSGSRRLPDRSGRSPSRRPSRLAAARRALGRRAARAANVDPLRAASSSTSTSAARCARCDSAAARRGSRSFSARIALPSRVMMMSPSSVSVSVTRDAAKLHALEDSGDELTDRSELAFLQVVGRSSAGSGATRAVTGAGGRAGCAPRLGSLRRAGRSLRSASALVARHVRSLGTLRTWSERPPRSGRRSRSSRRSGRRSSRGARARRLQRRDQEHVRAETRNCYRGGNHPDRRAAPAGL